MATKDPFTGTWNLLSFPGTPLAIDAEDAGYKAQLPGFAPVRLEKDEWSNLKSDELCLSLHGSSNHLFGLRRDPGGAYSTFAAIQPSSPTRLPACGEDWDAFDQLVDKDFTIRVMQATMRVPVQPEERVRIRKTLLPTGLPNYQIGTFRNGKFDAFDDLCPDRANGTLNSRQPGYKETRRNVSLWLDKPGTQLKIFSMVAVGAKALEIVEGSDGQDLDLVALGLQLSLLPAEVRGLIALAETDPSERGPGDPMIVWGADDGGG